jgi:hypothetical protein
MNPIPTRSHVRSCKFQTARDGVASDFLSAALGSWSHRETRVIGMMTDKICELLMSATRSAEHTERGYDGARR